MRKSIAIILISITSLWCIEFTGFLESYLALGIKNKQYLNSHRTRFKCEFYSQIDDISILASIEAQHNSLLKDETKVSLYEAYFEYVGNKFDVRIGKQVISWGKADGLRITDIICPLDMSEFITQDFDESRIPIEMVKIKYLPNFADFEFIIIPEMTPAILPHPKTVWVPKMNNKMKNIHFQNLENKLENFEIASKMSLYAKGIDIALSVFYTFDDIPTIHLKDTVGNNLLEAEYHRTLFSGIELSKPLGEFVFRMESALFMNKYLSDTESNDLTSKKDLLKGMIGIDWYASNDWSASFQIADDYIINHKKTLQQEEHLTVTTLRISKKILRQTLELYSMIYIGLTDQDFYWNPGTEYQLNDNLKLSAGLDIFGGEKGGMGQYKDNSQIWLKGKYSF